MSGLYIRIYDNVKNGARGSFFARFPLSEDFSWNIMEIQRRPVPENVFQGRPGNVFQEDVN
jgi:hypothetical protein